MDRRIIWTRRPWLAAVACVLPMWLRAQAPQTGDPPGRAGRISALLGAVSFQAGGDTAWSDAVLNYTVTTGDRLFAGQDGQAEVEVGMLAARMSASTDVTITNLTDHLVQLGLAQGTLRVSVYRLDPGDSVEVDTPNGALMVDAAGSYRFDVSPDAASTTVSVDRGGLDVTGPGLSEVVRAGQAVLLTGQDPITLTSVARLRPTAFDQWSAARDTRWTSSPCSRYMSSDIPGCADLGSEGTWTADATYGPIWYPPAVVVGWVPYRYGHWAWVDPWGWTWVEDEPWGYAPFHYGRWAYVGTRWGWVPGPIVVRPYYAPALVAFVGGSGFTASFSVGVQAWFPLGPREPFFPWYHHSAGYLVVENQTNVRNVPDINVFVHPSNIASIHYVNRSVAITVVPSATLSGGRPVAHDVLRVTPAEIAKASIAPHPSIAPTRRAIGGAPLVRAPVGPRRPMVTGAALATPAGASAVRGGAAKPPSTTGSRTPNPPPAALSGRPGTPPASAGPARRSGAPAAPRPIITKTPPPTPKPPFAARAKAMAQDPGRPLEPQQVKNLQAGKPAGPQKDAEYPPHPASPPKPAAAPAKKPPPKKPPAKDSMGSGGV